MNNTVLPEQKKPISILIKIIFLVIAIALSVFAYNRSDDNLNVSQQEQQSETVLQQSIILKQEDVINTSWLRTLNPIVKNVEGRVVWSRVLQEGVLEFIGLPKIKSDQQYQLWIYDLLGEDSEPTLSTEFSEVSSKLFLVPFATKSIIKNAFKFELVLKTAGEEATQPLLLAQP